MHLQKTTKCPSLLYFTYIIYQHAQTFVTTSIKLSFTHAIATITYTTLPQVCLYLPVTIHSNSYNLSGWDNSSARTSGIFYEVVVQAVLLYGMETWFMSPLIGSTFGEFHHRVARVLTGRQPRRVLGGRWLFPPLEKEMAEAVIKEAETYLSRHQNTAAQYIYASTIINLCLTAEIFPGKNLYKQCWDN